MFTNYLQVNRIILIEISHGSDEGWGAILHTS